MPVHEKIKFIRQLKGWSQEEVADKLAMSANGCGSIERGETDVNLSRLEQIAGLFEIELSDLIALNEKNVFYLTGTHYSTLILKIIIVILQAHVRRNICNCKRNWKSKCWSMR